MKPPISDTLLATASQWEDLHRWERKQLGLALRRLGLTYSEIQTVIPVPNGTLSNWCQEVVLTSPQIDAIQERVGPNTQRGIPRDTQWKRRLEIDTIRSDARLFATSNLSDPRFVGGVVLYWGEGSKTRNHLDLVNTDPAALRYFTTWVRAYLDPEAEFKLWLHLHTGNDEEAAKTYWSGALNLGSIAFGKTHIKSAGTGHRKNHLPHGICRVRTSRASSHWHRVMVWIEVVAETFGR